MPPTEHSVDGNDHSRLVLMVEDDNLYAELISELMGMIAPYVQMDRAASAEDALVRLEKSAYPDLLLLDLCLPGLDGWEVLDRIRGRNPSSCPPIVILTSSVDPADRDRACQLGANAYLAKPASASQLRRQIEAVVTCWLDPLGN